MSVEIQVKLYGMLRQYRPPTAGGAPHHPFSVVLGEPATITAVLKHLGVPADLVMVTAVNQETVDDPTTPLQDGDQLGFFPPVAGGRLGLSEKLVSERPFS